MRSPVHPNPMVFPLGLLTTAAGVDVLHVLTGRAAFALAAGHLIAAGLLLGVVTVVAGWLAALSGEGTHRTGPLNVVVLVLFGLSWAMRLAEEGWVPPWTALAAGWLGVLVIGLGGELLGRRGTGESAHRGSWGTSAA